MSKRGRPALRVLLVAGQAMARAGLRGLLAGREDLLIIGDRAHVGDAGDIGIDPPPDVVLASWDPGTGGEMATLNALAAIGIPVVMMGDMPAPRELQALLRAGLRGYLLPDANSEQVGQALSCACEGLLVFDPHMARTLATPVQGAVGGESTDEPLTEREREVLQLMALGLSNKLIARRLDVTEHTVKFHVGSVLAKLGATSRTEAVTSAVRQGLVAL